MTYVNYNMTNLQNVAKYTTGAAINHTDVSFADGVIGYGVLMGGAKAIQGGRWLIKNRKDYKGAINRAKANFQKNAAFERSLKGKNFYETVKNTARHQKAVQQASAAAAANGGKLAKAGKFMGGNGGFAAISLACEAPNIYKTYKELGADRGHKQLLKSAAIVGAETAGYAIGAKAGAAAGAAIGTAICPGIGTAVGAVAGVLVGLAGSWLAGKGMRAIVGKDELQKAKEDQARRIALQVSTHPEYLDKVMAKAGDKLLSEDAEANPDTQIALQAFRNIAAGLEEDEEEASQEYAEVPEGERAALPRSEKPEEQRKQNDLDKHIDNFIANINGSTTSGIGYPFIAGIA